MQLRAASCLLALSTIAFASGVQEPSRPAPPVMDTQAPPAPTKKSKPSRKHGPHSVELNWKPSVTKGVDGYYVYRADGGISGHFLRITPQPLKKTQFKDTKVHAGAEYAYAVSSVQKIGKKRLESDRTPAVAVKIPKP
jgi:hypothetical protein